MNIRRILLAALILCASPALAKTVSITGVVLDQSGGTVAPSVQKLSFAAGETGEIDITVTHPDGTPYNLGTGVGMTLGVNGQVVSRSMTVISAAAGTAKFPLVIADTINMLGTYTYDVALTAADGSFYRVVPASSFVVTAGIVQPGQPVTVPASQQPLAQGPQGPAGNPQTIYVAGVAQTSEPGLNFASGMTCTPNPGANRNDCSIVSGTGSVTSVAMSMPAQFSVTGSPVTTSGTLSASWVNQTANTLLCGPTNGVAAAPTFRALVAADLPASGVTAGSYGDASHSLSATVNAEGQVTAMSAQSIAIGESQVTGLVSDLASKGTVSSVSMSVPSWLSVSGSPVTTTGTLAVSAAGAQTQNEVLATPSGVSGAVGLRSLVDADMPAHVADCAPTTAGDYCSWSGTSWQRTAAPVSGGGTQGGTTTASHIPYASSGNTLGDTNISYNSTTGATTFGAFPTTFTDGTHTLSIQLQASAYPAIETTGSTLGFLNGSTSGFVATSTEVDFYVSGGNKFNVTSSGVVPAVDSSVSVGGPSARFIAGYIGGAGASQPTCDANHRGAIMTVFAAAGAADTLQVCMKGTADTYAWRTVYTAP